MVAGRTIVEQNTKVKVKRVYIALGWKRIPDKFTLHKVALPVLDTYLSYNLRTFLKYRQKRR